ncbi:pirin family protein [Breznakiella homolactica]|uniref:Pirin family protein n=1 Tax=Breznakiella homolactica TaxID=2798577 RepID=A0A7T8BBY5_9SPIR|nr:pirin family protein [Breznakiella homolactica]QQO10565.1 pirin family protein [Breznakiella homolactica]
MKYRRVKKVLSSIPTIEGGRVYLKRAFGFQNPKDTDPFLMLDYFHLNDPDWYEQGFPWHPHRGFECITYMHAGAFESQDSLGNRMVVKAGGVQQVNAGSGIIHQETPLGDSKGQVSGFQLWINTPAGSKWEKPVYQNFKASTIPEVAIDSKITARMISGNYNGLLGPVQNDHIDLKFLDIIIPPHTPFIYPAATDHTVIAFVVKGSAYFDKHTDPFAFSEIGRGYMDFEDKDCLIDDGKLVMYDNSGNDILITSNDEWVQFLLISGKPIGEPVAWYGPVVMNKQWELRKAYEEYGNGEFVKDEPEIPSKKEKTLVKAV